MSDVKITLKTFTKQKKKVNVCIFCIFFYVIVFCTVYTHPGPSAGYPDAMSYMMDGQAQMMHRPPDAGFHQGYHYPPAEYYGHHL